MNSSLLLTGECDAFKIFRVFRVSKVSKVSKVFKVSRVSKVFKDSKDSKDSKAPKFPKDFPPKKTFSPFSLIKKVEGDPKVLKGHPLCFYCIESVFSGYF